MISPIEDCQSARDYLARIGARIRTLFTAVITTEALGYEKDVYSVRFDRSGNVRCPPHLSPTQSEQEAISLGFRSLRFPTQQTLAALPNGSLPPLIRDAPDSSLFIFRDRSKSIRFIQVRIELDNGDKRYVPQTYWSDGQWRMVEPEDGLPIYGLETVERGARVFLHEGAKSAKVAAAITKDKSHPWSDYFSTGVHVGWIGGAHHLHRTLWNELRDLPGELIIVPDNDFIGRTTISKIAAKFTCPCFNVQLDNTWPKGWDVADQMPEYFFSGDSGLYVGPDFEETLQPCDWATEQVAEAENGRPIYGIRQEFAQSWVRIQNLRHYAHISNPEITLDKDQFNIKVRPFSDVTDTQLLLSKMFGNICDKVTFMPNQPTGLIHIDGESAMNQYVDRRIKPARSNREESTEPFWRFMDYLFPQEEEKHYVRRWMATLYARPDVRMGYGVLLLSKLQGVGKSTLLDMMAAMIGKRHASFPGDAMVQSDFNGWVVNKRLVVVHEIYAGQNWKTYNRLKSLITDDFVEANNKHLVNYTLPNWSHYAAASNSLEALRMEHDDRRWLVPRLPETLYRDYEGLRRWTRSGGLRYLAQEFLGYGDYVKPGDTAPRTASKSALIDQSMPSDERMVLALCERMPEDSCIDLKDVWLWLQTEVKGRAFVSPQRIASLLTENGYSVDQAERLGSRVRQLMWKSHEARKKAVEGLSDDALTRRYTERLQDPHQVFRNDATM